MKACGQLNGKKLTLANIAALQGSCYIGESFRKCQEKDIQRYQNLINKCGEPEVKKFDAGVNDILYDSTENYKPVDPYYRCVDNFLKKDKTSNLFISSVGTFSVSQKGRDNTWICKISTVNSKIRAVPDFFHD